MSRSIEIVVLSEDVQHECFARRFLQLLGGSYHRYRFLTAPRGRGSGEQWVRERFPGELRAHRHQRSRVDCCLLTIIDADTHTLEERVQDYRAACASRGVEFLTPEDRVAMMVPARNIESWLAYLRGEAADETTEFPKLRYQSDCQSQATALHEMCVRGAMRDPALPSLHHACQEFRRLRL